MTLKPQSRYGCKIILKDTRETLCIVTNDYYFWFSWKAGKFWRRDALGITSFICKMESRDFPGGPVVKNLPSNAGDSGSIPGGGTKIPHAVGQLSPCATTTELACLN